MGATKPSPPPQGDTVKLHPINTSHKWVNIPDEEMGIYNAIDCLATAQSAMMLLEEASDHKMLEFWQREVWPLAEAVVAMQRHGLYVDPTAKARYTREVHSELKAIDQELLDAAPGYLSESTPQSPNSLGSGQKVARWLYDELGLRCTKRTETGKPSVDQEALLGVWRNLRKKDAAAKLHLENLIHCSRLKTISQRYLNFDVDIDGRTRPTIKMIGTETGRFAYSVPPIQQWPEECRQMIGAPPGMVLVGVDYMQLEARIAAILFNVSRDLEILKSGEDLHAITAKETFAITHSEWESMDPLAHKARRNYTKSFRYRIIYGGDPGQVGALGTKVFCPCPRHEHEPVANLEPGTIIEASKRFLANRPEIERSRWRLLDEVRRTHALHTPLGRRRLFFGPVDAMKREIFNFPIQSTAADIINRAMRKLYTNNITAFLQMHDYLGTEAKLGDAQQTGERIRTVMEAPCPELNDAVFPVELKFELPWGSPVDIADFGAD